MKYNNSDSNKLDNCKKFEKCIVLPYVKNIYERVSSSLKKYSINCDPRATNKLDHVIIKGKDRIKKHKKNN